MNTETNLIGRSLIRVTTEYVGDQEITKREPCVCVAQLPNGVVKVRMADGRYRTLNEAQYAIAASKS